jgi:hypothetical protein
VRNKRVKDVKSKLGRYRFLGSQGFSKTALARATIVPATCYGIDVTGASDSTLLSLRRVALGAVATSTQGGCLDSEWFARDGDSGTLDPAFQVHAAPLISLAAAWWDHWRPHEALGAALAAAKRKLTARLKPGASVWSRANGPISAALLSASRLGWVIQEDGTMTTDIGETLELGVDSPAAIQHAVQQSVRRWRAANVLQKHSATRGLLSRPSGAQPDGIIQHMGAFWARASANSILQTYPEDFSTLLQRKRKTPSGSWHPAHGPYLLSAAANKQWPQGRVVAARHAQWSTDPSCQLCKNADGTFLHRHECPVILEMVGKDSCSDLVRKMQEGMGNVTRELWRTRGIGAVTIRPPLNNQEEWLEWIRRPLESVDEATLTWYVDASQIDDQCSETRRFGFGLVATNGNGRLVAAALGAPPRYVTTISQAEAHAVAAVLASTSSRKQIITDCLANVTTLAAGFAKATDGRKRAARTWRLIQHAADGDPDAVPLQWRPAHKT